MYQRKLTCLAILAMLLVTLSAPLTSQVSALVISDPSDWYKKSNGVLYTDTYSLYPYAAKSLDIGFSKFGEFINAVDKVGLQYGGYDQYGTYDQSTGTTRDPFANELVTQELWVNGWLANITYRNRIFLGTPLKAFRNVWAFALYSDGITAGGNWTTVPAPTVGIGGRQTNKLATTQPIQVLYNGPREFIAMVTTTIYDHEVVETGQLTWPVLDVVFTIIENKVKKEVIVYKELKLRLETKYLEGLVDVQFSNRGEWDLGPSSGTHKLQSYPHFEQHVTNTSYGSLWHTKDYILRDTYDKWTGDGSTKNFTTTCAVLDESYPSEGITSPHKNLVPLTDHVFVSGTYMIPGMDKDYLVTYWPNGTARIDFITAPGAGAKIEIYYKNYMQVFKHEYSLAQLISADAPVAGSVVGYAAFWPTVSDYTVDGWDRRLKSLLGVAEPEMNSEPSIPFVTGEWDVTLDIGEQWRGVTVYGVCDYHDAKDPQFGGAFVTDREERYQLDEVFQPWDLYSAVEKKTTRWLQWSNSASSVTLEHTPVVNVPDEEWDKYCVFAERVEKPDGTLLHRRADDPISGGSKDYTFTYNSATGVATLSGLPSQNCKILYSTAQNWWSSKSWSATLVSQTNASYAPGAPVTLYSQDWAPSGWTDPLGATWNAMLDDLSITFNNTDTAPNGTATFAFTIHNNFNNFKVFKEETAFLRTPAYTYPRLTDTDNNVTATVNLLRAVYTIKAPSSFGIDKEITDIHVDWFHPDLEISGTISTNSTNYNATVSVTIAGESGYPDYSSPYLYEEHVSGRYEWIEVGRDAASVDSVGAALVSAAFKNKQVEIGMAGVDMYDTLIPNQIPWVMRKFGTGNVFSDYFYTDGTMRAAIKDDWCTTWPISSSNMIFIGGAEPWVNLGAYYLNDFTDAKSDFPGTFTGPYGSPYAGKIFAVPCWSKLLSDHIYASSNTVGYAVISTYKDINGTVGLSIYGHWGRDTYYACKWFHDDGIYEFQTFPAHATSVILKITYTSTAEGYKPTSYSVVEVLGTISETLVESVKGGIHPDP